MLKTGKKVAAALAAVQLYLQQEQEAASVNQFESVSTVNNMPGEPGQWAQAGRVEMMGGRRLVQLRAFSNAR